MTLQEKNDTKATLQGVAIALLYYGLLRAAVVQMVEMEDVKVETTGICKIIEVTFKQKCKQRNEGFVYYVLTKFFPIFSRYMDEICQDNLDAGNVQFLKNWNKIGKRQVQNTGKNNVNILHQAVCKILKKSHKGYYSHCWRRSVVMNLVDAGVLLINLK